VASGHLVAAAEAAPQAKHGTVIAALVGFLTLAQDLRWVTTGCISPRIIAAFLNTAARNSRLSVTVGRSGLRRIALFRPVETRARKRSTEEKVMQSKRQEEEEELGAS